MSNVKGAINAGRIATFLKLLMQRIEGLTLRWVTVERCHCELYDEVSSVLTRYRVVPDIVARAQNEEWALASARMTVWTVKVNSHNYYASL